MKLIQKNNLFNNQLPPMKRSIFIALFSLSIISSANAQTLKFGHIDSGALIQMLPQTKQADSTLKKFGESLDTQLKGMTAEYQNKLQAYQSKADSMPDLIRSTKEKELGDLKSRFVSMASHEFRTPLSTILSWASLLAKYTQKDEQDKRDKHINRIKSAVNNLTDILNEFLSIGKINLKKYS